MKVLITGAGGQLGRDLQLHLRGPGRRRDRRHPRHARHHRPRRGLPGRRGHAARRGAARRGVHGGRRLRVRTRPGVPGQLPRHPVGGRRQPPRRGPPRATCRPTTCSTARRTSPTSSGTRPTRARCTAGRSGAARQRCWDHAPGSSIVRISWVCGEYGNNMVKTVLKLADRPELAFVDDQRGHPTFTADLAVGIRRLAVSRVPGLFHMTNQGAVSWYEFVRGDPRVGGSRPGQGPPDQDGRPRPAPAGAPSRQLGARQRRAPAGRLPAAAALPREPRPPGGPPHRGLTTPQPSRSRRRARSLTMRRSGSMRSRTSRHSSSRGYIAGTRSGRRRLSLAR